MSVANNHPLAAAQAAQVANATPQAVAPAAPPGGQPDPADPAYRAKATAAAVQFEGFFIAQMLHQMRAGVAELAPPDSAAKDPTNAGMLDMVDNMVADKIAGQRAFGIADVILRQLLPPAAAPAKPPADSKA